MKNSHVSFLSQDRFPCTLPEANMGRDDDTAPSHDEVELYSQTFWSVSMASDRKKLLQILSLPLLYTSILMWACLSLYWGSLLTSDQLDKLDVLLVNREDHSGLLGPAIVAEIVQQTGQNSLRWTIANSSVEDLVRQETVWAAVEGNDNARSRLLPIAKRPAVSASASSSLSNALAVGNALYDPTNAITLFYASARNQITVNSHVVPAVLSTINPVLSAVAINNTASFLRMNINDTSALETALRCPQCLTVPFVLKTIDLVPFDSATATGSVMVGMIFVSRTLAKEENTICVCDY